MAEETTEQRFQRLEAEIENLKNDVGHLKDQAAINRNLIGTLIKFFNDLADKMAGAAGMMRNPPRIDEHTGEEHK